MSKSKRFHIGNLRIGDWIHGMHLERVFENLFNQKNEAGQILLKPAATKVANGLDQILVEWNTKYEPVFDAAVSNEGQASAEKVEGEVTLLRDTLRQIEIITDVPELLEDYRFAEDDNRNKFYHEFTTIVFSAFSDSTLSEIETGIIIARLITWIKTGK